ncbi:unnamed protein product [Mytilus coruscus]|uniref:CCHC-type domain-containing protein n=1 Tax=Mytilus coruscus TaxID=42192 RepID=A0A6J8BH50_MYTCO|nr:unnamed protein product [Mytilus coruscus]
MPRVSDRDRNRHTGGSGGNRFDRKCFKCNKSDHLISNCPLLRNKVGNVQKSGPRGKETPVCNNVITLTDSIITTQVSRPMIPAECEKKPIKMPVAKDDYQTCIVDDGLSVKVPISHNHSLLSRRSTSMVYGTTIIIGNIDGAREPYDPDISLSVSVVTRQQAKQRDNPYPKLKVSGSIKDVSLENIEREQQSGESLMKLRQYVTEDRHFEKTNGTKIAPEAYRTDLMKLAHESLMAGHMATRRTVYRVLSELYWPGVEFDVKWYCRSCKICQRTVPKGKQIRAPLSKTLIIDVPFRRVAVYIVGPLVPVTDKGNRYILTLVDYATRYPEGVALPSI